MVRLCILLLTLCCLQVQRCASTNGSKMLELSRETLDERTLAGRMLFVYFGKQVTPTLELFLEQLELSAEALEDYGISVAKIDCTKEDIPDYCGPEKLMKKVYLFRGTEMLRSFDTDTVFDVNAIVSHVLFTVLFNEVHYVHTPAELLSIERAAKGKVDVVFGHIQVLGLPEHRALMEAAFVYGSKFHFVLTTGGPVLKHMGVDDPASLSAGLWFLHCKAVSRVSDPCVHTAMRRPLATLHIHTFLQLMQAPLLTEVSVDPDEVELDSSAFQLPLLFLFSLPQTAGLDRAIAETLAWRLRGDVGVVLIHRDSPDVQTPVKYNAAYRLPGMATVKYVTFNNIEEVVSLFTEKTAPVGEEALEEKEEEDEDQWTTLDVLDDEVAESVYRDRDQMLDMEPAIELTRDTFASALAKHDHLVVLFYVKWDAVSMAFMHSFAEVAEALEGLADIALASVDCGEWTHICSDQQITSFPSVVTYCHGNKAQLYQGMLGRESLHRFILLSRLKSPIRLASSAEVRTFLEGGLDEPLTALAPVRVLGAFSSSQDPGVPLFEDAALALRGEILLGMLVDAPAQNWARELSVDLPVLLVCRGPEGLTEVHSLQASSLRQLIELIRNATLDPFPELTVENLPEYLELQKPLLLLFVAEDDSESSAALQEIRGLRHAGHLQRYLPCWINLRRTPAGSAVLESYLGTSPQLPALVLSQLRSGGEVFHFPSQRPLQSGRILQWLQGVERQEEEPAGVVPDQSWGPRVPFFDFLSVMDKELPGYATQRSPKAKTDAGLQRATSTKETDASLQRATSTKEEEEEMEGEEKMEKVKEPGERRGSRAPTNTRPPHTHTEL